MKSNLSKTIITILLITACSVVITSCESDDEIQQETAIDDPNDSNDDPVNSTGRFSDNISCSIISTPTAVSLNPTYTKYINCSGIPVVGSVNVTDEALLIASQTTEFMLNGIGAVRNKLITGGAYIILYEEGLTLNNVIESGGNQTGDAVYRFDPNNNINYAISPVTNLLCDASNGQAEGNILVHEFAHMIDIGGIRQLDSGFSTNLQATFNSAISSGLWNNTRLAQNKEEYFAVAVTIWFGSNWIGPEGGDGLRNNIGTRGQLLAHDPSIYNLINERITSLTDVPGCRTPVIDGATANCPETITDIDGNTYEVVNIGPMCWMKENLRTTRYKDGTPIAHIESESEWESTDSGAWSYYDNDASLAMYGNLYNGIAATNPAGLCPEGWHVPSIQELSDLTQYAGGDVASRALKESTTWNSQDGTNTSSFTALPSGWRHESGFFSGIGNSTFLISTTFNASQQLYAKSMFDNDDRIYIPTVDNNYGSSCRCIKNQ